VIIEDSFFDISNEEQNHEDLECSADTSLDKEAKRFLSFLQQKATSEDMHSFTRAVRSTHY
jgi:hypothetical protein